MAAAEGDPAPDFELEGTDGTFKLSDQRGRKVVLLFYPGDFTPVCTRQFCSYAERADDFDTLDAVVVGISSQDLDRHKDFKEMHGIPVPLLADTDKAVAKAYGVASPIRGTRRAVIIVDEQGRIAHRFVHTLGLDFQSVDDIREVLDSLGTRHST
jgi:thioredoxin-dependent peroxiredoxin